MASIFGNCTIPYIALTAIDEDLRRDVHNSLILISSVMSVVGGKLLLELYDAYKYYRGKRAPQDFTGVDATTAKAPVLP